jgi:hypothetical protein
MSMDAARQSCLGCGRTFECGMNQSEPCWCSSEFSAVMPLPDATKGCYCKDCLAALIAAARQEKKAT